MKKEEKDQVTEAIETLFDEARQQRSNILLFREALGQYLLNLGKYLERV